MRRMKRYASSYKAKLGIFVNGEYGVEADFLLATFLKLEMVCYNGVF